MRSKVKAKQATRTATKSATGPAAAKTSQQDNSTPRRIEIAEIQQDKKEIELASESEQLQSGDVSPDSADASSPAYKYSASAPTVKDNLATKVSTVGNSQATKGLSNEQQEEDTGSDAGSFLIIDSHRASGVIGLDDNLDADLSVEADGDISEVGSVVMNDSDEEKIVNESSSSKNNSSDVHPKEGSGSDPTRGIDREAVILEHQSKFGSGKDTFTRKSFMRMATPRHQRLNSVTQIPSLGELLNQHNRNAAAETVKPTAEEADPNGSTSTLTDESNFLNVPQGKKNQRITASSLFTASNNSLAAPDSSESGSMVSIEKQAATTSRRSSRRGRKSRSNSKNSLNRKGSRGSRRTVGSKHSSKESLNKTDRKLAFSIPNIRKLGSILHRSNQSKELVRSFSVFANKEEGTSAIDAIISNTEQNATTSQEKPAKRRVGFAKKAEMISFCAPYPRSDFFRSPTGSPLQSLDTLAVPPSSFMDNDNSDVSDYEDESGEEIDESEFFDKDDESGDEVSVNESESEVQVGVVTVNGDIVEKTAPLLVDHDEQHHMRMIMMFGSHNLQEGNYTPTASSLNLAEHEQYQKEHSELYAPTYYNDSSDDEDIIADEESGEELEEAMAASQQDTLSDAASDAGSMVINDTEEKVQLPTESPDTSPVDNKPYFYLNAAGEPTNINPTGLADDKSDTSTVGSYTDLANQRKATEDTQPPKKIVQNQLIASLISSSVSYDNGSASDSVEANASETGSIATLASDVADVPEKLAAPVAAIEISPSPLATDADDEKSDDEPDNFVGRDRIVSIDTTGEHSESPEASSQPLEKTIDEEEPGHQLGLQDVPAISVEGEIVPLSFRQIKEKFAAAAAANSFISHLKDTVSNNIHNRMLGSYGSLQGSRVGSLSNLSRSSTVNHAPATPGAQAASGLANSLTRSSSNLTGQITNLSSNSSLNSVNAAVNKIQQRPSTSLQPGRDSVSSQTDQANLVAATPAGRRNFAEEISKGTVAQRRALFSSIIDSDDSDHSNRSSVAGRSSVSSNTGAATSGTKWKSSLTRQPTKAQRGSPNKNNNRKNSNK